MWSATQKKKKPKIKEKLCCDFVSNFELSLPHTIFIRKSAIWKIFRIIKFNEKVKGKETVPVSSWVWVFLSSLSFSRWRFRLFLIWRDSFFFFYFSFPPKQQRKSIKEALLSWKETSPFQWPLFSSLCHLAIPNFFSYFVEIGIPVATTYFTGHLGPQELAASLLGFLLFFLVSFFLLSFSYFFWKIGNVWCNAFGLSLVVGLVTGLDSIAPQAYGGQEKKLLGLYCQRACVVTLLACIPVTFVWLFANQGLQYIFRVEKELAELAGLWVLWRIPGLYPIAFIECTRKYLLAQSLAWPIPLTCLLTFISHVTISWLAVTHFGFVGASIGISVSEWLMLIFLFMILKIRDQFTSSFKMDECWPSIVWKDIFDRTGLIQFLRFGLPAAGSLFLDWGGFEVYGAIVAQLGEIPLAAHSILNVGTCVFLFMAPFSFSLAGVNLLGNELGLKRAKGAQSLVALCFFVVLVIGQLCAWISYTFRRQWGQFFSTDEEVVDLYVTIFPLLCLYLSVDGLKCWCNFVMRGLGRPSVSLLVNFFTQVLLGYVLAYLLGKVAGWGLFGVWVGMTTAWVGAVFCYLSIILVVDWDEEVGRASKEISIGKGEGEGEGELQDEVVELCELGGEGGGEDDDGCFEDSYDFGFGQRSIEDDQEKKEILQDIFGEDFWRVTLPEFFSSD